MWCVPMKECDPLHNVQSLVLMFVNNLYSLIILTFDQYGLFDFLIINTNYVSLVIG